MIPEKVCEEVCDKKNICCVFCRPVIGIKLDPENEIMTSTVIL